MTQDLDKAVISAAHTDRCKSDVMNEDWTTFSAYIRGANFGASFERDRAKCLVESLEYVIRWFNILSQDQDDKLGHGLERAIHEWPNLIQEPLNMLVIKDALAQYQGSQEK